MPRRNQLESLTLECHAQLTPRGFQSLLTTWPGLRRLRLEDCQSLGAEGYRLAASLSNLTRLELVCRDWQDLTDSDMADQRLPAGLTHFKLIGFGRYYYGHAVGLGLCQGLANCRGESLRV